MEGSYWKFGVFLISLQIILISNPCQGQKVDVLRISETCSANFITQDYIDNWEDRIFEGEWKIRMASKLHIYLLAHNLYRTTRFKKFDEEDYTKGCFVTDRINGWGITNTTGFNEKHFVMRLVRTNVPKTYRFAMPYTPFGPAEGTASVILSDNDLYTAFEFCFDNGLRTFAVFSRNQINDDKDAIKLHLKSIGFNEKNFVDLRPNNQCEEGDEKGVLKPKDDSDLPEPSPTTVYVQTEVIPPNAPIPVPPNFFYARQG